MNDINLLSRILDSLPVFIGLVNEQQRYEYVNATYVARYNLPKEKIIGMSVEELNGKHEYEKSRTKIEAALRGENVEFEYSVKGRHYRINYVPNWQGKVASGYFVISTDITHIKATTIELQQSIEELRSTRSRFEDFASFAHMDRIASVGAMAIGLAHDISQPISSINILVDALSATVKESTVEQRATALISDVQHQVQFAADIINRLRRFSSNKVSDRKETNLNGVIKEALAMMNPRIHANDVVLQVDLSPIECLAYVDGIEIQQVLVNLMANAIESVSHLSEGPRIIRIFTENDMANWFVCRISDNGPGVSETMTDKLFTAFESDKESGSGIGLAISHKLVQQNGGDLRLAENRSINNNAETMFVLRLPIMQNSYSI